MSGLTSAQKNSSDLDIRYAVLVPGSGLAPQISPPIESTLAIETLGDATLPLDLAEISGTELSKAARQAAADMRDETHGK